MEIKIRLATSSDIDDIVSLCLEVQNVHETLFPEQFKPIDPVALSEFFKDRLNEKDTFILLANIDESVVGYLKLNLIKRPAHLFRKGAQHMEADQICVTKSARRKGVARSLLEKAKEIARERGINRLALTVWSMNSDAKRSFEQLGFSTFRERMELQL